MKLIVIGRPIFKNYDPCAKFARGYFDPMQRVPGNGKGAENRDSAPFI